MVSSKRFFYEDGKFSAEVSDLYGPNKEEPWIRVWPDSCDIGLDVVSETTGNVVRFVVTNTKTRDGEILYWDLEPTPESKRKVPGCRNVKMILFND